jgi:ribosomal silencing factor RsfS
MEKDELYNNLVILIKMFDNKPYTLAKYLLDNNALTDTFIKSIMNSEMLKKINDSNKLDDLLNDDIYFIDITEVKNFYNSFFNIEELSNEKNIEDITKKYNEKLNELVANEKYEEAAKVYNYMLKNKIKKI